MIIKELLWFKFTTSYNYMILIVEALKVKNLLDLGWGLLAPKRFDSPEHIMVVYI